MNINHVLLILFGVLFIVVGAFAQTNNFDRYSYGVFPPLTKEREIVIVATKNSPKKIKIEWLRPDGSSLFSKEFNVVLGEKVIISPVKE